MNIETGFLYKSTEARVVADELREGDDVCVWTREEDAALTICGILRSNDGGVLDIGGYYLDIEYVEQLSVRRLAEREPEQPAWADAAAVLVYKEDGDTAGIWLRGMGLWANNDTTMTHADALRYWPKMYKVVALTDAQVEELGL